jgi:2,4-dienoyl-CoA reductase-like NADH-dependent reductase (Old Yellow Enzyme family)
MEDHQKIILQKDSTMSHLFSPLSIRGITIKNRLVVSPMCMYSSVDGFLNDWHLVHLGSHAVGGAALVIQEATAVSPGGRITYADAGIWKDEHMEKQKQVTAFIRQQGSIPGIQLAHAGRKSSSELPWKGGKQIIEGSNSWQPDAPSAIPFREGDRESKPLSVEEIYALVADFKSAARRARQAGYEVVEIHGAHGYLIHEFLSPLSNHRADAYGGSFENRIRFLRDIVAAVREEWPSTLPLFVRISATDWAEGGWDIDSSVRLAGILKTMDVDLIDVSSGGLAAHQQIALGPGYQVPFAERIKKDTGLLTGGCRPDHRGIAGGGDTRPGAG